jgi:hypothetical protein
MDMGRWEAAAESARTLHRRTRLTAAAPAAAATGEGGGGHTRTLTVNKKVTKSNPSEQHLPSGVGFLVFLLLPFFSCSLVK